MDMLLLILWAVLAVVFLLESWVLFQILRQHGRLLLRIEPLETRLAERSRAPRTADARQAVNGQAGIPQNVRPPSPGESGLSSPTVDAGLAQIPPEQTEADERLELTIGMATYNDYNGVYFTLLALRLYQDLSGTEVLVIDNYGCQETRKLVEEVPGARYIRATDVAGTAAPRDRIFREARGNAVLCCDCHVLFVTGAIARLKAFYREHPDCQDLLQGPLLNNDGQRLATHFDPVWRAQMWGTWASDPRGAEENGEPFEIPMQGLGAFSCLKRAWPGFHPQFRGFGGEEGYIHEKFRQAGHRTLCLPWLRWMHRFGRPSGPGYLVMLEDRLHNYVIGHDELGIDLVPVLRHFSDYRPEDQVIALAEQVLGGRWTGSAFICEEEPAPQERDARRTQPEEAANGPAEREKVQHTSQILLAERGSIPLVSAALPVDHRERHLRATVEGEKPFGREQP